MAGKFEKQYMQDRQNQLEQSTSYFPHDGPQQRKAPANEERSKNKWQQDYGPGKKTDDAGGEKNLENEPNDRGIVKEKDKDTKRIPKDNAWGPGKKLSFPTNEKKPANDDKVQPGRDNRPSRG
jgi:hypothetical protein